MSSKQQPILPGFRSAPPVSVRAYVRARLEGLEVRQRLRDDRRERQRERYASPRLVSARPSLQEAMEWGEQFEALGFDE